MLPPVCSGACASFVFGKQVCDMVFSSCSKQIIKFKFYGVMFDEELQCECLRKAETLI